MSYLVIGTKSDGGWDLEVQGVGKTHAGDLAGIEVAVRVLLATNGREDASNVDLQLLMPDFEVDLQSDKAPLAQGFDMTAGLLAGLIALAVIFVGLGYLISLIF
ncbi:MAG TPA: hypothetical protein VFC57_07150 [Aeromicrobium sp.]|nr:hypothetical protein [Aeromicrobium sp.]HZL06586.1 hypothetical protein [Coriobacteriia bacterium]